ncbi:MAG: hypothetical protein IJW62_06195 [Clostridia bacterium]|nr:hypothetical protein [Clostridia bacterium]
MRKYSSIVAVLLAVAMLFSFVACGGDDAATTTKKPSSTGTVVPGTEIVIETFEGDFTWKDSVSTLATNWNPHTYQTADDAYPIDFITSGLYSFIFNDALNPVEGKDPYSGYKIIPEMAAEMPVDVTEDIAKKYPQFKIPEGATAGYAYKIALNKNAKWQDGTAINADTYVYSLQQLLDPAHLNYRATDYYSGNFCIAGAEGYANSGHSVKKANSTDGETMTYAFADLVKGEDGTYKTANGEPCFFGLNEKYAWMGGSNALAAYAGAGYIPEEIWTGLTALADEDGFVPVTDAAIDLLFQFTNSDTWGNETRDQLGYYVSYDYTYPTVTWDTVGLLKIGDYEITLVLGKSLAGFNLLYNLSGNWLVYEPYYSKSWTQTGDSAWVSNYNTSVETTMSYGPYKMVSYQTDKSMRFEKNENWYGWTDSVHVYQDPEDGLNYRMYQTTAIDCQVVAEAETRKLMFLKGELMGYGLQADDYDSYRGSKYCYATPGTSTFFLILNGHTEAINTREAAEDFDTAVYDLQTMSLPSFKKAMALSYDRDLFASTVSPSRSAGFGLIGTTYVYDPETGAKYRDTDQAKKALCEFYSVDVSKYPSLDEAVDSITGYDVEGARKYFAEAFEDALEMGYITDTDKDGKSDQTVRMEYCMSADSDFMTTTINYLNEKLNEVLVGTPFEGKIEIVKSALYGNDWSNKLKQGLADTCLAGWQGSALDPFGLTDLYANPNYQYDAAYFDAQSVDMTLKINNEEITLNLRQWSDALNGLAVEVDGKTYNFGDGQADVETRLEILAAFETAILKQGNYLPVLEDGSMALLSQQVFYVIEAYNPVMGRGGIAYTKYNFNDTEWAEYVKAEGGELKY